jgi:small-conductance mechanosensitive channel
MSSMGVRVKRFAGGVALFLSLGAGAAQVQAQAQAPVQAQTPAQLTVDPAAALATDQPITAEQIATMKVPAGTAAPSEPAPVKAMNRTVVTLRSSFLGWSAKVRAQVAEARIRHMLDKPGERKLSLLDRPEGTAVLADDEFMFPVLLQDTVQGTSVAARLEAQQAIEVLSVAIDEARESRNPKALLIGAAIAAGATLVAGVLFTLLLRARRRVQTWLEHKTQVQSRQWRLGGVEILSSERLIAAERLALGALFWLVAGLLLYEWVSLSLAQFPYTRVWAEELNGFLLALLTRFALATMHAIPDLFAAGLIFTLAYGANRVLKRFFRAAQYGAVRLNWLDADVAPVTSRLCTAAVWIFALVMAYPYLPGSDTDAFKGLSVLLGLMVSLGASNLVGQAASGLILTYTRTFRVGEYVRVADHEGTVVSLGAFTTRIRTGLGEELTISNSLVMAAVTKNYSRAVKGPGYVVDTTVTIGYDTPWRQVEAMLIEAARRTSGVLADPKPHVFQTSLSDFYPEYRLVVQAIPSEPRPRAEVMNMLHANIQDVFNEHGVQIMSPHYRSDPEQAKLVPPAQWFAAPAKPPPQAGAA